MYLSLLSVMLRTGQGNKNNYSYQKYINVISWRYILSGLLFVLISLRAASAAGLMVSPTRLVLDPGEKTGQVFIINKDNKPITVRISLVNRHMKADGTLTNAEKPDQGEQFAEHLLHYAPRRVQLGAGDGQTVRLLARRSGDLAQGEYRSHILFRVEPSTPPHHLQSSTDSPSKDGELDIKLVPVYGVTIPVIVRQGDLSARTSISDVSIQPADDDNPMPRVVFQINRSGNRSIYGDIRIYHRSGDTERLIGETRGLAVYLPLSSRHVSLPLNHLSDTAMPRNGTLHIEYVDHDNPDRVMAEKTSSLQP